MTTVNAHFNLMSKPLEVGFHDLSSVDVTLDMHCGMDDVTLFLNREQFEALRSAINEHAEKMPPVEQAGTELEDPRDEEERIFDRACEAAPLSYAEQGL
jgi:hypothetical protein